MELKNELFIKLEEDEENVLDVIDKIIDEIEDKIELFGNWDREIEDYLDEEYEDMYEGMCMLNKEGRLILKCVFYEVYKFCFGSLDVSCLL